MILPEPYSISSLTTRHSFASDNYLFPSPHLEGLPVNLEVANTRTDDIGGNTRLNGRLKAMFRWVTYHIIRIICGFLFAGCRLVVVISYTTSVKA